MLSSMRTGSPSYKRTMAMLWSIIAVIITLTVRIMTNPSDLQLAITFKTVMFMGLLIVGAVVAGFFPVIFNDIIVWNKWSNPLGYKLEVVEAVLMIVLYSGLQRTLLQSNNAGLVIAQLIPVSTLLVLNTIVVLGSFGWMRRRMPT